MSGLRDEGLRVCQYVGSGRVTKRSGLGSAMRHQRQMLRARGVHMVGLNESPDVVILNTVFPDSVAAGRFARARGVRVVAFAHSTREDFENSWAGANAVAPLFGRWLKRAYAVGDVIITPTPYSKMLLRRHGLTKPIYTLTNGVDVEFFSGSPEAGARFRRRLGVAPEREVVVTVGHLMARKGVPDYVELARRMPETDFCWFGHTPRAVMSQAVREAVDAAPPNVHFLGHVPADQVRDAYAGADLFCFMSHEETEGIVVLEALASGTPSLVRDIPVYDPWLPEGEIVHKARNLREFETKARAILAGEAPDLTRAAVARMQRHSFDAVADRLLAICEGSAPPPD